MTYTPLVELQQDARRIQEAKNPGHILINSIVFLGPLFLGVVLSCLILLDMNSGDRVAGDSSVGMLWVTLAVGVFGLCGCVYWAHNNSSAEPRFVKAVQRSFRAKFPGLRLAGNPDLQDLADGGHVMRIHAWHPLTGRTVPVTVSFAEDGEPSLRMDSV